MASIRDRAAMYQAAAEETAKFGDLDAVPPPREFVPKEEEALRVDDIHCASGTDDGTQLSAVAKAAQRYQELVENLRKDQDKPGLMEELERSREQMNSRQGRSAMKDDKEVGKLELNDELYMLHEEGQVNNEQDMKTEDSDDLHLLHVEGQVVTEQDVHEIVGLDDQFSEDSFSENYKSEAFSEGVIQLDELNEDCDFDNDAVQVDEEEQLPIDTAKPIPSVAPVLTSFSTYSSDISAPTESLVIASQSHNGGASSSNRSPSHIIGASSAVYAVPQLSRPLDGLKSDFSRPRISAVQATKLDEEANPSPRGLDEASFSSTASPEKRQSTRESVSSIDEAARERWRHGRSAKLPKAKVVIARRRYSFDEASDSDDVAAPPPTTRKLVKEYRDPAELLEGRVSLVDISGDGSMKNVPYDEFGDVDAFNRADNFDADAPEIDLDKHYADSTGKKKYRRKLFGGGAAAVQDRHGPAAGDLERERRKEMHFARRSSVLSGAIDRVSIAADPFIDFMSSHNPAPVAKARGPLSKLWQKLFKRHRRKELLTAQ